MTKQVITASYTAYVEYMRAEYPSVPADDPSGLQISPVDYKLWAKWMATD